MHRRQLLCDTFERVQCFLDTVPVTHRTRRPQPRRQLDGPQDMDQLDLDREHRRQSGGADRVRFPFSGEIDRGDHSIDGEQASRPP